MLEIGKTMRFNLFHFVMVDIIPVCFENISQIIVATSNKNFYEKDIQAENKPAAELYMLSNSIIENLGELTEKVRQESERNDEDDNAILPVTTMQFEKFCDFLLKNSFSSDHN
jgi:hypothetical protein